MIYAGPVYLFVGLPLSIFIDKLIEKSNCTSNWARYFVGLGLYSLFGICVGFIFLILLIRNNNIYHIEVFLFSIYGLIASNIYYHLLLLININRK